MPGVAAPVTPVATPLSAFEVLEAKKKAGLVAIAKIFAVIQAKHLAGTTWTSVHELPKFKDWWDPECYSKDVAATVQAALNWARGFDMAGVRQHKCTPAKVEERWLLFANEAMRLSGGIVWQGRALKTALTVMRQNDKDAEIQERLVASGVVVAADRVTELERQHVQDAAKLEAKLEQQQHATARFQSHILQSQQVIMCNQKKLEIRNMKLSRQVATMSAKKATPVVYHDPHDSASDDSASHVSDEDGETKTQQRRPRRAGPSTPTPSAPPRRRLPSHGPEPARELLHEREPEASTSSSRPHRQHASATPSSASISTSTRTSTSTRRHLGHGAPPSTASGSPHHVRTLRRVPFSPAVGYDVDDAQEHPRDERSGRENVGRSGRSGQGKSHDAKDRVREGGVRARKGSRVGEASSSSDEADTEGDEPGRTSSVLQAGTPKLKVRSSRQTAAAAADPWAKGAPLEHDEPEKALDGRSSASRRSRVSVAPIAAQRTFHPLRSIDEGAVQRGDPPTPTSSASREAPARSALKRRSIPAQTTKRGTLSRSGAERMYAPRDEAYEVGEDGTPERAAPEAEMRELERICATFDALGQTSDDRGRTPGPASSSSFDRSASPSLSTSPPPSPNVTPRSKSRRRRMIERRESGAANVADVAGMPGAFCPSP
ncbi:hypothetical protein JCM8208_005009 [Rhodotorula glutinis]